MATLKQSVFTFLGPNVQNVASAVEQIYPLLFECQKKPLA